VEKNSIAGYAVLGIAVGLGLCIAGLSVSNAVYKLRASQRFVTVKGLAEREVDADLVVWPLTFEVASSDLNDLQKQVDAKRQTVRQFLTGAGFEEVEISQAAPRIRDTESEVQYGQSVAPKFRYIAQATLTIITSMGTTV
jgi:hypothetical protein